MPFALGVSSTPVMTPGSMMGSLATEDTLSDPRTQRPLDRSAEADTRALPDHHRRSINTGEAKTLRPSSPSYFECEKTEPVDTRQPNKPSCATLKVAILKSLASLRWPCAQVRAEDRTVTHTKCLTKPAAVAALVVLPLAGCIGGGDQPTLDEIRAQTGLATPIETPADQKARAPAIVSRADSLILSSMPGETDHPALPTFRAGTRCSGTVCEVTLLGSTQYIGISDLELTEGTARAIGTRYGVTLVQESARIAGASHTSLGSWMVHSAFAVQTETLTADGTRASFRYSIVGGDLTGRPLTGSATWLGIMVGTPATGDRRGENLVGTAALNYDFFIEGDATGAGLVPALDVAFSNIQNIDRGEAHGTEAILFPNLAVGSDGTFQAGVTGERIQGGLYGPNHAEAAGIFESSNIVGAFGAKR